jgi:hypothetical protein
VARGDEDGIGNDIPQQPFVRPVLFERWDAVTSADVQNITDTYWTALDSGIYQSSTAITYQFPGSVNAADLAFVPGGQAVGYRSLQPEFQEHFRFIAEYVSNFTGLNLVEVSPNAASAQIVVGQHNMGDVSGYADYPSADQQYLMLNSDLTYFEFGNYGTHILVHELGHTLGLDHPFTGTPGLTGYSARLPENLQGITFTVMSYDDLFLYFEGDDDVRSFVTFSPLDVRALQEIYTPGSNTADHQYTFVSDPSQMPRWEGNTLRSSLDAPFTLVDTGGADHVDLSGYAPSYLTGTPVFSFTDGLRVPTGDLLSSIEFDAVLFGLSEPAFHNEVRMLTIQPGTVIEKFTGTQRDDRIIMADGDQEVIGSGGLDRVVFDMSTTDATIQFHSDFRFNVTDRNGAGGSDSTADVEQLEFTNRTLELDSYRGMTLLSEQELTELTEMYVAYFNRAADAEGLYFWADVRGDGMSLEQIAEFFFDQPETRALYTNPDDTDAFVTAVYDNVLGRTPDQAGFEFWRGVMERGEDQSGRSGSQGD